jgi:hypothetical protein
MPHPNNKHDPSAAPPYTIGLGLHIPEKHWTSVSLHTPQSPPPAPRPRHSLLSLTISRTRVILRLISLILSTTILGLVGDTYSSFYATKGHQLIYAGEAIWPENIDLAGSNVLIVVAAVASTFSSAALVAGLWPRWRHVTAEGDVLAAAVAGANLVVQVVGAVVRGVYTRGGIGLKDWTCAHKAVEHPQAEFENMCSELVIAERMGCGVVVVEVLGLGLVVAGCVLVRRRREGKLGLGALRA